MSSHDGTLFLQLVMARTRSGLCALLLFSALTNAFVAVQPTRRLGSLIVRKQAALCSPDDIGLVIEHAARGVFAGFVASQFMFATNLFISKGLRVYIKDVWVWPLLASMDLERLRHLSTEQREHLDELLVRYDVGRDEAERSKIVANIDWAWHDLSTNGTNFRQEYQKYHCQLIVKYNQIKPRCQWRAFAEAVVKYLWPRQDHYQVRPDGVYWEFHHKDGRNLVVVYCKLIKTSTGGLAISAGNDFGDGADLSGDETDEDGGLSSVCRILHGLTARISALERAVDTTVNF